MNVSRLAKIGLLLGVAAAASLVWFITVVHRETGPLVLFLGLLLLGLISASSLCLLLALAGYIQARRSGPKPSGGHVTVSVEGEYVARYSWSDRVVALLIVAFFGGLTFLFWFRSARPQVVVGCSMLFAWALYYAAHITGTSIRFTVQGFVGRVSWLRNVAEPYNEIQHISGRPGTLMVQFADGQSLKFHSGMGNPEVVIARLKAKCPNSVQFEG